jgi:hypothetical protein
MVARDGVLTRMKALSDDGRGFFLTKYGHSVNNGEMVNFHLRMPIQVVYNGEGVDFRRRPFFALSTNSGGARNG